MSETPVVTMVEDVICVNSIRVGRLYVIGLDGSLWLETDEGALLSAPVHRAIADFLDQLAGANLLSGIGGES